MTQPFRTPLIARLMLLIFIALQAMMLLDVFDSKGAPAFQLATGVVGIAALLVILMAWLRHRRA